MLLTEELSLLRIPKLYIKISDKGLDLLLLPSPVALSFCQSDADLVLRIILKC